MSVTYPEDHLSIPEAGRDVAVETPFVPVYARRGGTRRKGGFKAWMIMVPVGVITLGGIGAMMLTAGDETPEAASALVEPAQTVPAIPAVNPTAAMSVMPEPIAATPVETAPPPPPATRTRVTPVQREATRPAPQAVRPETPTTSRVVEPTVVSPTPPAPTPGPAPTTELNIPVQPL